jgi:hypothetical protein
MYGTAIHPAISDFAGLLTAVCRPGAMMMIALSFVCEQDVFFLE